MRRSTRCTNKRDAQRFESELRRQLLAQKTQSGYTFSDAALRWLTEKKHKRSISTDLMILDWFEPHLANTYLSDISRDRVEQLRLMILAGRSRETVNRYMALLRSILRIARDDWEWVEKIPKIPMYPHSARPPQILKYAGMDDSGKRTAATFICPGMVCRVYGAENKGNSIVTVGLDKSRRCTISTRDNEKQPLADDSTEYDCVLCAERAIHSPPYYQHGFCESCWQGLGRKIYHAGLAQGRDEGRP